MFLIDFNSTQDLALFIGFMVLCLFFAALIGVFYLTSYSDRKYLRKLRDESNSLRVFVVDSAGNDVTVFNSANLRKIRHISLDSFYRQFNERDQDKVRDWLQELLDKNTDTPEYLEADVMLSKNKQVYFSLIKVSEIDFEHGKVYLESHILKYITPKSRVSKNDKKKIWSTKEEASKMISNIPSTRGAIFAFRFYYKKPTARSDELKNLLFTQLKNAICPLAASYNSRVLIDLSLGEVVLVDTKVTGRGNILHLAHIISKQLKKCIDISGHNDSVSFSIGAVEHKFFPHDIENLIRTADMTAIAAEDKKETTLMYEKDFNNQLNDDMAYKTEIENILKEKKLQFFYRPIVDVTRSRTEGYFMYIKPFNSFLNTIDEVKEYAKRTGDDKELFSTIAKSTIPTFASEKDGDALRLFYPLSYYERSYVLRTFPRIAKINEAHIVLQFSEREIHSFIGDDEERAIADLRSLKAKGYEICLSLEDKELLLNSLIYEQFDYFVVGLAVTEGIKVNSRIRLFIHGLVEKLLKYKKPIIATDIESWPTIELLIKAGITYISSETISPSDEMVLPINKKVLSKIESIK